MRHLFLVVLFLTCMCASAQIRFGQRRDEQVRTVVTNYCRLDYEGARLANESWTRMKPLTTWKDNPDWHGFTVILHYDVLSATSEGLHGSGVTVNYAVLGRFERGLGYTPEPGKEEGLFRLKGVDGDWRIDTLEPPINPHVSKARAIAWLKSAMANEKNTDEKIEVQKALKDLGA